MSYAINFSKLASETLSKWKKSNPLLFKKTQKLLIELSEHPREGSGRPEPLVGGGGNVYSRRISANERMIYKVHDAIVTVVVLTLGGHYGDK